MIASCRGYDVVVVGAGSAGGVLAARLSEDAARSVLLVEAGQDFGSEPGGQPPQVRDAYDTGPTEYDWGHRATLGRRHRESPVFAGRLVGGSSATNNTMALRGQPADYDRWVTAGNTGWSFDEVLEAFIRLESDLDFGHRVWHGTRGPVAIARRPARAAAIGTGPLPLNAVEGTRQSTALTYLAAARTRPNLTIRPGVTVDRVRVEDGRTTGVMLADGETIPAGRVLLAAGTYGSPAILLRSGIGPAAALRECGITVRLDRPGVGENLHDHPLLRLRYGTDERPSGPPLQTLLTLTSGSDGAPDVQIFPAGPIPGQQTNEVTLLVGLLTPASRGRLRLRSADPTDPPLIDTGILTDSADLPRLRAGLRQARHLAATPPLADYLNSELWPGPAMTTQEQLTDAIRSQINVYQHPVGTCKMGPADDPPRRRRLDRPRPRHSRLAHH